MKKTYYYEVHAFFGRQDGYSIGVKIDSVKPLTEDQVIQYAADHNLFTEDGDQNYVDYVEEVDLVIYNMLTT